MGLSRYALYLHDYGSQFGFRLAMAAPERVTAPIIQNGDITRTSSSVSYPAGWSSGSARSCGHCRRCN